MSFNPRDIIAALWLLYICRAKRAARKLPSTWQYCFSIPIAAVTPIAMSSRKWYHTIHQGSPNKSETSPSSRELCRSGSRLLQAESSKQGRRFSQTWIQTQPNQLVYVRFVAVVKGTNTYSNLDTYSTSNSTDVTISVETSDEHLLAVR